MLRGSRNRPEDEAIHGVCGYFVGWRLLNWVQLFRRDGLCRGDCAAGAEERLTRLQITRETVNEGLAEAGPETGPGVPGVFACRHQER